MFWNDLRYALRLMRRNPGFTAVAALSLALGIGANTAIFSLVNTILLRKLAVAHPEQIVEFLRRNPGELRNDGYWGWEKYEHFRDRNHAFSALTGMSFDNLASVHMAGSEPQTLIMENVLGNYFPVLGLKPAMGRLIGPEDVLPNGQGNVAVVSWWYWNGRLQRDPAVLGKRIFVNDAPMTIIGIAPRAYKGPRVGSRTDVWTAHEKDQLTMLGRLRSGVTLAQAQAEASVLYQSLLQPQGADRKTMIEVEPAGTGLARVRDQYGKPLVLLMAVVGLLLLLACINMASLLLARSAGRQREMAVRVGLGASRGRLMKQVLTESVLLSAAGTLVGILLAYFGTGVLVRIMASGRAHEHIEVQVEPDLNLLIFTAGIAVLTGLLFGLAPAWYAFRSAPASSLRQSGKGGDTWFWRLFGKGLVAAQVALSILLVTAAAVFLSHLSHLRNMDVGFRSDHVLLVQMEPVNSAYKRGQWAASYQELLVRLQTIPGVRSASITGCTPMQGCGEGSRFVAAEGYAERPEDRRRIAVSHVAPKYFETLGIPLIAGRDFDFKDAGRPRVMIVNQAMARRYFPGGDPIGKHVKIDRDPRSGGWYGDDTPYEVVGVVGDIKGELHEAPWPGMYVNMFQEGRFPSQLELRTSVDPVSVAGAVRHVVREVLRTAPVTRVTTLADQVDSTIVPERLIATLSGYFGGLGAALAGIGLYGLLAYTVARRTNEIGVRMALGATARDVSRLVLRDALGMLCVGLAAGACLVFWSKPLAGGVVQDLKLESVWPLVLGGSAIAAAALLASCIPALRAARVDPMVALRHE